MRSNNRVIYLDVLRIIAMMGVIVIHVSGVNVDYDRDMYTRNVLYVFAESVRWSVPLFVMVSGSVMLGRDLTLERIVSNNIIKIVTHFIFWSSIYAVMLLNKGCSIRYTLAQAIKGPTIFWYLYLIVGLYLIIPIVDKIIQDKRVVNYFLLLCLLFNFFVPETIKILSLYSEKLGTLFNYMFNNLGIEIVIGYSGYFVLGWYLKNIEIQKKEQIIAIILGVISFCFGIIQAIFLPEQMKMMGDLRSPFMAPYALFEAIAIFVICKSFIKTKQKIISNIGSLCFGIYLIHGLVQGGLNRFGINAMMFNAVLAVPVVTVLIFGISLAIAYFVDAIPRINKYII